MDAHTEMKIDQGPSSLSIVPIYSECEQAA